MAVVIGTMLMGCACRAARVGRLWLSGRPRRSAVPVGPPASVGCARLGATGCARLGATGLAVGQVLADRPGESDYAQYGRYREHDPESVRPTAGVVGGGFSDAQ